MTKKSKIFDRIKNNPKNVRFNDVKLLLLDRGFQLKRSAGSHFVFSNNDITFVIPTHNNKVKEIYVKRVIDIIDNNESKIE